MTKDNSTGKDIVFYSRGKRCLTRYTPLLKPFLRFLKSIPQTVNG